MEFIKHKRKGALSELIKVQDFILQGGDMMYVSISAPDLALSKEVFEQGYIAKEPYSLDSLYYISKSEYDKKFEPIHERILDNPVKHNLNVIFQELKFGRPSESQQFLDDCIKVLESGEKLNHISIEEKQETFYDRLLKESKELSEKVDKLDSFLSEPHKAKQISGETQYDLLLKQQYHMNEYLNTLDQRIIHLETSTSTI